MIRFCCIVLTDFQKGAVILGSSRFFQSSYLSARICYGVFQNLKLTSCHLRPSKRSYSDCHLL